MTKCRRPKNPQARAKRIMHRRHKINIQAGTKARRNLHLLDQSLNSNISIVTDKDDEDALYKCDSQRQSPLFRLPFDVRDTIFRYALSQYDDVEHPYKNTKPYCRPGYRGPHCIQTDLLLTCRLSWLEYNDVPLQSTTHTYWFFDGPPSKLVSLGSRGFARFFDSLTLNNLAALTHVRLFASVHWLEGLANPGVFGKYFSHPSFRPKTLTIAMRNTDWKSDAGGAPLTFDHIWIRMFLDSIHVTRVQNIELELETVADPDGDRERHVPVPDKLEHMTREQQLDKIVEGLCQMKKPMVSQFNGDYDPNTGKRFGWQYLIVGKPKKTRWTQTASGATAFNKKNLNYVVTKLIWSLQRVEVPSTTNDEPTTKATPTETRKQKRRRERPEAWHERLQKEEEEEELRNYEEACVNRQRRIEKDEKVRRKAAERQEAGQETTGKQAADQEKHMDKDHKRAPEDYEFLPEDFERIPRHSRGFRKGRRWNPTIHRGHHRRLSPLIEAREQKGRDWEEKSMLLVMSHRRHRASDEDLMNDDPMEVDE